MGEGAVDQLSSRLFQSDADVDELRMRRSTSTSQAAISPGSRTQSIERSLKCAIDEITESENPTPEPVGGTRSPDYLVVVVAIAVARSSRSRAQ